MLTESSPPSPCNHCSEHQAVPLCMLICQSHTNLTDFFLQENGEKSLGNKLRDGRETVWKKKLRGRNRKRQNWEGDEERRGERLGGRRGWKWRRGGGPLAGLSGAVRMMNGRPAPAVRALMGAAELYITLLSVCERLLKALNSAALTRERHSHQTSLNCTSQDKREAAAQVRTGGVRRWRGEEVTTRRRIVFRRRTMKSKGVQQQSSIITAQEYSQNTCFPEKPWGLSVVRSGLV